MTERALRVVARVAGNSLRGQAAYRAEFWIAVLQSTLGFATGLIAVAVLFDNVNTLNGWTDAGARVVLGVFFVITGLHGITVGPSLNSLANYDGRS